MVAFRLAALLLAVTTHAAAGDIVRQIVLDAEPDDVWAAVGEPCGIAGWHPEIAACTTVGDRRILTARDGTRTVARILERDAGAMRFSVTTLEGPLPLSDDNRTTILVADQGDRTRVTWRVEFTPAGDAAETALAAAISAFLDAGLAGLKRQLGD